MFSQKLWLVVIANTLLLQCCIADVALSTVKTSSGRSLYSNVDSQNSNIEITPDSFSKSDSSFSASQSEISQNESSMVNTGSGISLQDSSSYSSSSNVAGSNSNTVAGDGFISQTDSNFETSSSTTAESDTSITTTPDSTVMSSTTSSSTSTMSSSAVTSSSINGQFLDSGEADISFPDNFPPIGPSYETKSLDSIPDFDDNSLEQKTRLGSPLSQFPPSLGLKPFMGSPNPKLPPNFPKFPNSSATNQFKNFGPKGPYSPVGTFNSKPTPKIGTPIGPAGMSTSFLPQQGDNPLTSPDISKPFPPLSDSPINSPIISELQKPLPSDLLPNNPLQNDISPTSPLQQPFQPTVIDDKTLQPLGSNSIPESLVPNDISSPYPPSLIPGSDLPTPLSEQPILENIPSESLDTTSISQNVNLETNQYPSPDSVIDHTLSDLANPMNGDKISNSPLQSLGPSTEFPPNMSSYGPEFPDSPIHLHPSSPYDSIPNSSETDISIEFHSNSDEIPDYNQPDMHSQFPEQLDYPINPHSYPPNDYSSSSIDDALKDWNLSDYPITPGPSIPSTGLSTDSEIPTVSNPLTDDVTISSPYNSTPDNLYDTNSPFPQLPSVSNPLRDDTTIPSPYDSTPDHLYDTDSPFPQLPSVSNPLTDDTTIPSPYNSTPDHLYDTDSPFPQLPSQQPYDILKDSPSYGEDLTTPQSPYNLYEHPELPSITDLDSAPTLVSMDTNQDGFISPEEILESNNPTSPKPSPIDTVPGSSMDVNQDSFISPEEILESNNLTSPTPFPIDTIPDTPYLPQSVYDDSSILPADKEYPSPGQFSQNNELPLPLNDQSMPQPPYSRYNYPQKPKLPYNQLPGPKGPFKPGPVPPYPGFNQPSLGYPLNGYPPFSNNDFPLPRGPNFRKYPPYLPYGNDLLNYPPMPFSPLYPLPYGPPGMPSPYNYPGNNPLLYDYPRNYMPTSPLLNRPPKPDFYPSSPPSLPGNPLSNKPLYTEGPLFDSPKRPPYIPKNWSKIPTSRGSPLSPDFLPSSSSPLDSLSLNQPSSDFPPESLLPQSPYDSSIPDSPIMQPSFSPDLNNDLPFITQSPDSLPLIDFPSTVQGSPLSPSPLNLNGDYPMDSLPLDLDSNLPLATSDIPKDLLTPNSVDDEIFDILKQQYESTTAEYQLSNSIYPRDIAPNFDILTDADLTYNFVVLGSSPAALAALKTLSDTGKSILLIERGDLPPHISKSLYYRPKILQSDYVRKIKSSAPHCNVEKILYAPNVLGEESTYDSNVWDYGVRSKYIKWGKLGKNWTWNNVIQYFTDSSGQPDICAIPVSTEIVDTKAVNAVTSIFNDAGLYRTAYEKGKRLEGLTVIPHLQENGENIILAEKTFQQLTSCSNIQLALNTIPESIIFDNVGKAIGVVVKTPCGGTKTINILDELIIGTNPVDTVQFLYQSGIGDHERLQALDIPTQINLPYVGKELIITPLHFGVLYLFPQGTLLCDNESDFVGKDYLFGRYGLPSALAVDYLKASLNIYEAREANVVFNFRVFSKSMSERLQSYIQRLTHIDAKIKDFLTNLCQEYDLLLAVPQLTNVLSRGEIVIDNSSGQFEALVDTGMYKSKRDITIMQKALKVLKSIAETETFKAMNGKVVQIPVEQCGQPDFSTEYNRCSIRYLSLPNLHYCGGTIMGVSPLTSVVNEDLLLHGSLNVRILSQSVVPYGTSTDSGAVSSMIGNLGAHIISQKYLS